jgi:hypothetical protein
VLILLKNPVKKDYLKPKSKFHNALKEVELTNFKFIDSRTIKKWLGEFFKEKKVEAINNSSRDYKNEYEQYLDEPSEASVVEKPNKLTPILSAYEDLC